MMRMRSRLTTFKPVLILGLLAFLSPLFLATAPALAQTGVSVSTEFRSTLEPYGEWRRHARWGEIWTPANVDRGWRPYTEGRWVYTNDYGWYWVEDDSEAAWGLVAYHYGRWVWDADIGWCWVPGRQWAPAWVDWRRGSRAVGWAPLPPDEVIAEVRDEPIYWTLVPPGDLLAPRVVAVALPQPQVAIFIRETVVVNRTVIVNDRGPSFAVNPGIPASYIAAAYGRPIRAYEVRPRVFAGTVALPGAVVMRAEDIRTRRDIIRSETFVRESREAIKPARNIPPPRPLAATERGRLGDLPPRAAQGRSGEQGRQAPDATTGARPRARDNASEREGLVAPRDRATEPRQGEAARDRGRDAREPDQGAPKAGREGREGAQERRGRVGKTESDSPARDQSGRSGAEMPRGDQLRERMRPPAAAEAPRRGGSAAGTESPRRGGQPPSAPSASQRNAPSVGGPRGGPGPETTGAAPRGGGPGLRDGGGPGLRSSPGGASGGPRGSPGGPGGPGGGPGGPR